MRNSSQEETLAAKKAYEILAGTHDVTIKRYHADNGRYAEEGFHDAVKAANQELTFCGVGAHHQNGIAKSHVKIITLAGRTLLLHAKRMWPEAITTMLWPLSLKATDDCHNELSLNEAGSTPLRIFCQTTASIAPKHWYPFGCPVYVLDDHLKSGLAVPPKWEPRARIRIYVGRSQFHASSVSLILNPSTGHVSPQYHLVYDDDFTIIPHMRAGTVPPNWADLVERSSELCTDEQFDVSQTWFKQAVDSPVPVFHKARELSFSP